MIGPNPTRVCVDWVYFPMLCSESDAKFRQHLPAVLQIHVSAKCRENVHPENNGEVPLNNVLNLHILGLFVESVGQSERAAVINMQLNAYLSMQPFRTGDLGYAT